MVGLVTKKKKALKFCREHQENQCGGGIEHIRQDCDTTRWCVMGYVDLRPVMMMVGEIP